MGELRYRSCAISYDASCDVAQPGLRMCLEALGPEALPPSEVFIQETRTFDFGLSWGPWTRAQTQDQFAVNN